MAESNGKKDNIVVAVRARPSIQREVENLAKINWEISENSLWQIEPVSKKQVSKSYSFDQVFVAQDSNEHVYNVVAKPIMQGALNGFHGTIFAYGQTSSGKTYTMMGNEKRGVPGIIPLAIQDLFQQIDECDGRVFCVRASYMEIYNEVIIDLLSENSLQSSKGAVIHEDSTGYVSVDVCEEHINSELRLRELIEVGNNRRHVGSTKMNDKSSRSHTIFRIVVESRDQNDEDGSTPVTYSQLNFVDLAGSENAKEAGTSGKSQKEGANINKSLFMLSRVINQLCENESRISYRDSKLTRLLQSSLGGNAKTAIVCTVTTASTDQTHSTLRFASNAKSVKNKPIVNEQLSEKAAFKKLDAEIKRLKMELEFGKGAAEEEFKEKLSKKDRELDEKNRMLSEREEQYEHVKKQLLQAKEMIIVPKTHTAAEKKKMAYKRRMTWGGHRPTSHASLLASPGSSSSFPFPHLPFGTREPLALFPGVADMTNTTDEDFSFVSPSRAMLVLEEEEFEDDDKESVFQNNIYQHLRFSDPMEDCRAEKGVQTEVVPQSTPVMNVAMAMLSRTPSNETPSHVLRQRCRSLHEELLSKDEMLNEYHNEFRTLGQFRNEELDLREESLLLRAEKNEKLVHDLMQMQDSQKTFADYEQLLIDANKQKHIFELDNLQLREECQVLREAVDILQKKEDETNQRATRLEVALVELKQEMTLKCQRLSILENERKDFDIQMEMLLQKKDMVEEDLRCSLKEAWEQLSTLKDSGLSSPVNDETFHQFTDANEQDSTSIDMSQNVTRLLDITFPAAGIRQLSETLNQTLLTWGDGGMCANCVDLIPMKESLLKLQQMLLIELQQPEDVQILQPMAMGCQPLMESVHNEQEAVEKEKAVMHMERAAVEKELKEAADREVAAIERVQKEAADREIAVVDRERREAADRESAAIERVQKEAADREIAVVDRERREAADRESAAIERVQKEAADREIAVVDRERREAADRESAAIERVQKEAADREIAVVDRERREAADRERAAIEREQKEAADRERAAIEREQKEAADRERATIEREQKEAADRERAAIEREQKEAADRERAAIERVQKEAADRERAAIERVQKEAADRERAAVERQQKYAADRERAAIEREQKEAADRERAAIEREQKEAADRERTAIEREQKEAADRERAAIERVQKEAVVDNERREAADKEREQNEAADREKAAVAKERELLKIHYEALLSEACQAASTVPVMHRFSCADEVRKAELNAHVVTCASDLERSINSSKLTMSFSGFVLEKSNLETSAHAINLELGNPVSSLEFPINSSFLETSTCPSNFETSTCPSNFETSTCPSILETSIYSSFLETSICPSKVEISINASCLENSFKVPILENSVCVSSLEKSMNASKVAEKSFSVSILEMSNLETSVYSSCLELSIPDSDLELSIPVSDLETTLSASNLDLSVDASNTEGSIFAYNLEETIVADCNLEKFSVVSTSNESVTTNMKSSVDITVLQQQLDTALTKLSASEREITELQVKLSESRLIEEELHSLRWKVNDLSEEKSLLEQELQLQYEEEQERSASMETMPKQESFPVVTETNIVSLDVSKEQVQNLSERFSEWETMVANKDSVIEDLNQKLEIRLVDSSQLRQIIGEKDVEMQNLMEEFLESRRQLLSSEIDLVNVKEQLNRTKTDYEVILETRNSQLLSMQISLEEQAEKLPNGEKEKVELQTQVNAVKCEIAILNQAIPIPCGNDSFKERTAKYSEELREVQEALEIKIHELDSVTGSVENLKIALDKKTTEMHQWQIQCKEDETVFDNQMEARLEEVYQLEARVRELEGHLASCEAREEGKRRENVKLQNEVQKFHEISNSLQEDVDGFIDKIGERDMQVSELLDKLESATSRSSQFEKEVAQLRQLLEVAKNSFLETGFESKQHEDAVHQWEGKLNSLNVEIAQLQAQLIEKDELLFTAVGKVERLSLLEADFKCQLRSMEATIIALKKDNEQLEMFEATAAQHEKNLASREEQLLTLTAKMSRLEEVVREREEILILMEVKEKDLTAELTEQKCKLELNEGQLAEVRNDASMREAQLRSKELEVASLTAEYYQLKSCNEKMGCDVIELKSELETLMLERQSALCKVSELQARQLDLVADVSLGEKNSDIILEKLETLKACLAIETAEAVTLHSQVGEAETNVCQITATLGGLRAELAESEEQKKVLTNYLQEMQERIQVLEADKSHLEEQIVTAKHDIHINEKQLSATQTDTKVFKEQLVLTQQQFQAHLAEEKMLTDHLEELRKCNEELQAQKSQLEEQLVTALHDIHVSKEQHSAIQAESNVQKEKMILDQQKLQTYLTEKKVLTEQLQELQKHIRELEPDRKHLEEQLVTAHCDIRVTKEQLFAMQMELKVQKEQVILSQHQVQAQLVESEKEKNILTNRLRELQEHSRELEDGRNHLKEQLVTAQHDIHVAREQFSAAQTELQVHKEKLVLAQQQLASMSRRQKTSQLKDIDQLQEQFSQVVTKSMELGKENELLRDTLETLRHTGGIMSSDEQANLAIKCISERLDQLQMDHRTINDNYDCMEKELEEKNQALYMDQEQIEKYQRLLMVKAEELNKANCKCIELEALRQSLEKQIQNVENTTKNAPIVSDGAAASDNPERMIKYEVFLAEKETKRIKQELTMTQEKYSKLREEMRRLQNDKAADSTICELKTPQTANIAPLPQEPIQFSYECGSGIVSYISVLELQGDIKRLKAKFEGERQDLQMQVDHYLKKAQQWKTSCIYTRYDKEQLTKEKEQLQGQLEQLSCEVENLKKLKERKMMETSGAFELAAVKAPANLDRVPCGLSHLSEMKLSTTESVQGVSEAGTSGLMVAEIPLATAELLQESCGIVKRTSQSNAKTLTTVSFQDGARALPPTQSQFGNTKTLQTYSLAEIMGLGPLQQTVPPGDLPLTKTLDANVATVLPPAKEDKGGIAPNLKENHKMFYSRPAGQRSREDCKQQ